MMTESAAARTARGTTLHLCADDHWRSHSRRDEYLPEAFAGDGFVHCTDGEELLIEVANRYYRDDPRPYVVLDVDLGRVQATAIYEDAERRYPHIYGPIERGAVRRVRRVHRGVDGAFTRVGDAIANEQH